MERVQSRIVSAPGGAGRSGGSGWRSARRLVAVAACAAAVAGVGCVSAGKTVRGMSDSLGLTAAPQPATQLTTAFQPNIQHLPDPTQDGTMRPGIVGQMFLMAVDGKPVVVDGDLSVMATDATPRPPGMPPAVSEMWHFDKLTLRKLKSKDERFGDCYILFLPYPPNWKDVTQIQVSTKYEPKPDSGTPAGPVLNGSPQLITLDFTAPGKLDVKSRLTSPVEVKGIPSLGKAIAQGRTGAPISGPQPGPTASTPPLPPPLDMTKNPYAVAPGAHGGTVQTAAYALPPGQTIPPGWTVGPNRELIPPGATVGPNGGLIAPPGTNPMTVAPPPNAVQPPTAGYGMAPPTGNPAANPVPQFAPNSPPAPLPSIPPPANPTPAFDPNSPVGPWANGGNAPSAPGFPSMNLPPVEPNAGAGTMVIPRR